MMSAMKSAKTRHQFYLPDDLSAQLDAAAARGDASKTAILSEALAAWFERKGMAEVDERFGARLDRQSRRLARVEQKLDYATEALGLFIRHQLTLTAHQPTFDAETNRLGRLRYDEFLRLLGRAMARSDAAARSGEPAKGGSPTTV